MEAVQSPRELCKAAVSWRPHRWRGAHPATGPIPDHVSRTRQELWVGLASCRVPQYSVPLPNWGQRARKSELLHEHHFKSFHLNPMWCESVQSPTNSDQYLPCFQPHSVSAPLLATIFWSFPASHKGTSILVRGRVSGPHTLCGLCEAGVASCSSAGSAHWFMQPHWLCLQLPWGMEAYQTPARFNPGLPLVIPATPSLLGRRCWFLYCFWGPLLCSPAIWQDPLCYNSGIKQENLCCFSWALFVNVRMR